MPAESITMPRAGIVSRPEKGGAAIVAAAKSTTEIPRIMSEVLPLNTQAILGLENLSSHLMSLTRPGSSLLVKVLLSFILLQRFGSQRFFLPITIWRANTIVMTANTSVTPPVGIGRALAAIKNINKIAKVLSPKNSSSWSKVLLLLDFSHSDSSVLKLSLALLIVSFILASYWSRLITSLYYLPEHMPEFPPQSSITRFRLLSSQSHFVSALSILGLISIWMGKVYPRSLSFDGLGPIFCVFLIYTVVFFKKKPKLVRLLSLCIVPALLYLRSSNLQYSLRVYGDLFDKKVTISGEVQDDAAYNQYGDYEFNITKIKLPGSEDHLPGRVRVRTKQNIALYRGDMVLVGGKLKPALGSRTGSISYASVEVINHKKSTLEDLRLRFFSSIYSSLPEPHASLAIGFLAGVRSSIPKEFQDQLSKVGLTHIVAVSGYNLTILVLAVDRLGKKFSKYQRTVLAFILIFLFLLITGFSPSVVRAAVICAISISCSFFGRKISPVNIILLSALITSAINPTYLLEDIGWWLSFLAFSGVLILAPTITQLIYRSKEPGLTSSLVIESLSAQILTAPVISHIFGTFSLISLLANILVVPLIPAVMALTLIVGLVGMLSTSNLSLMLGSLPRIILTPIIIVIERLSSLPWASLQLRFSQTGVVIFYALIFLFIIISKRRLARRDAKDI